MCWQQKSLAPGISWIRGGSKISGETIKKAVDASLKRLQTDYIDLYQLHWTNRQSPHFSAHWPGQIKLDDINAQQQIDEHLEILSSLKDCVKEGKIRHIGLSNDTPWGINQYLRLAEIHNLPKIVSLQNEFSLIHLNDSPHIFETCALNDIAYLPWSPLGGGALSGKYMNGAMPEGCRWSLIQRNGLFRSTSQTHAAIDEYHAIAKKHGLSLAQMSLAWVYQFKAATSTIIGATSMQQLKENLEAYKLTLNDDVLKDIKAAIRLFPVPF